MAHGVWRTSKSWSHSGRRTDAMRGVPADAGDRDTGIRGGFRSREHAFVVLRALKQWNREAGHDRAGHRSLGYGRHSVGIVSVPSVGGQTFTKRAQGAHPYG